MELKSKRLWLREYRPEDWATVHEYASIAEFSQYEIWGPNTIDDTKKFIADAIAKSKVTPRFEYELAICLEAKSNLQIGGCGIRKESPQSEIAHLGWAVNPKYQGQGIATEAASTLIDFGFDKLSLKMIYASCDTRNIASYRVMEKLGMKRVAMSKEDRVIDGKKLNSYRYEIKP